MSGTQAPLPTGGESTFQRVLQQFKDEHLNGSEREQFQFINIADFKSSMKEIQDEQASKARMRNMSRLRKFLEGMEQFEKLIEIFLNVSEFVAFVWVSRLNLPVSNSNPDLVLLMTFSTRVP
jgi:hypothetical protein